MHTGTVHCALGRFARGPNVSCPRAASARAPCRCRCPPRRRPPSANAPSPASSSARGSRERALSPRERQASEGTESGVPSTDPTAAPVPAFRRVERTREGERARPSSTRSSRPWCAKASARARRARAPRVRHGRGSGRRTELGSACVAMAVARTTTNRARIRPCSNGNAGGAWNVRAKASHLASVMRALRAPRGSRERALSPRERQASECTESGVPSTDPTAAPVPALRRVERAREGDRARRSSTRSELRSAPCTS
jgi:hypothetical protein